MSSDLTVVTYRPEPDEWAWAFGGQPAVRRVQPGTVLELYTEDCFGGRVQGVEDLPSQVCEFPYLNPVTGPFHVEGAEPGDTLAVHFVAIEPARDWAVSSTFPHFGALTAFLLLHVSVLAHYVVRGGSRDVWRHVVSPVLGFLIIGYVIISANVAAQRIGLLWLALGGVVLVAFYATGRPPRLGALDAPGSDARPKEGRR